MKRLVDKNRKAEIMAKLHLNFEKYDSFQQNERMTSSQLLRQQSQNDQLSKQLSKLLESNQRKKNELKKKIVEGPISFDLNQQMEDLRWRMDVLRQNHRSERNSKSYQSLTGKINLEHNFLSNQKQMTFDELYDLQKQKFSALRERRKNKRLNIQYLQMIGNKDSRKQRNKQLIEQKFAEQIRLLDEAIEGN